MKKIYFWMFALFAIWQAQSQIALPYFENFSTIPAANGFPVVAGGSWTKSGTNTSQPTYITNQTTYNRTGNGDTFFMTFRYDSGTFYYFVGPFDLTQGTSYTVSVMHKADGLTGFGPLQLTYGNAATAAAQTNVIASKAASITNTAFASLSNSFIPTVTGSYYFAVKSTSNGNPWYLTIDDFSVNVTPSCVSPTALAASNVTTTGANFSWTAPTPLPSSGYEWEVRTSGVGGSGATGLAASGSTTAGVVTASTNSLAENTTYRLYVRANCGSGDFSTWTAAGDTFFTGYCTPAVTTGTETYINNFSTSGGIQNISNLTSGFTTGAYQNNYATNLVSSYPTSQVDFSLTSVGTGTAGIIIWIDWNKNLIFDSSEVVYTSGYVNAGNYTGTITIPAGTPVGDYRMRTKIDFNASSPNPCTNGGTRVETEDYKVTVVTQPTDAVDYANLQSFVANSEAVSSIQTCQSVDVYARVYEPGLTEDSGPGVGIIASIGYSTTDTDPSTWPASAWKPATFNVNVGNDDEYTASYSALPVGTYYFASRIRLNGGAYRYGASNNGFWNATTNPNAVLTVVAPVSVSAVASTPVICSGNSTELTASSTNANYTYTWSNGAGSGNTVTVSPTETTIYTVTGTDSVTGCTSTATVTVTTTSEPTNVSVTPSAESVCLGSVQELTVSATVVSGIGTSTSATSSTSATLGPNPLQAYYGGTKQQWIYTATELTALGFAVNTEINAIKLNLATANTAYALNNVVIKMKNSTVTDFATNTSWETGLTTVRAAANYTASVGLNTFNLDTPFVWNGTDNLVIEMNYSNNNGGNSTTYNTAKYSATSFMSTIFYRNDNVTAANMDAFVGAASYRYSARTDITFDISNSAATWTSTGTSDMFTDELATTAYVSGSTVSKVFVKPTANTTYTASIIVGSCSTTASSLITIITPTVPNFAEIGTICSTSTAPVLASTSPNGVSGTWSPSVVDTSANGTYVFTPNAGVCASTQTLDVVVTTSVTPDFAEIGTICSGSTAPVLGTTSPNGVSGTWSPSVVDTSANGTYVFTPNAGVCASTQTLDVVVTTSVTPDFAEIGTICSTSTAPVLASTSPNGVSGTWSPSVVDTAANGTYVFTPNAGVCASTQTLEVVVTTSVTPDFAEIGTICSGSTAPVLGATSPNGVSGTWSPSVVDTSANGTYVFTPNAGVCASTQTLEVVVTVAPAQPTGDDTQYGATLADLVVSPTSVIWYGSEADALSGDNALASTTPTVDNETYYAVQVSGTCRSAFLAVTIDFDLSTPSYGLKALKVYPNPVRDIVNVNYSENITAYKLYNNLGQQLMVKNVNANVTQIDMSSLPAGSYLLEVSAGGKSKIVKLLKN